MSIRLLLFVVLSLWVTKKAFNESPIYLALLLIVMYFIYPEKYIWGLTEYRVVLWLNLILVICIFYHRRQFEFAGDIYSLLILGLLSSVIISALLAVGDSSISHENALLFLKVIFFWFMLKACIQSEKELNLFYWTCLLSVTFLSVWGVQQYILGNIRLEGFGGGQIMDSNQIAAAMIWVFPIAYFKFLQSDGKLRFLSLFCMFCLLAGIVSTQSRQAIVALIFCFPWYFVYFKRKSLFVMSCLLLVLLGSFIIPQSFFARMDTIQEYGEDSSAMGRIEQWKGAYHMFLDHPFFGVGGKNYYVLASRYVENPRVTHNTFFQILSEEGAVGIILFISMMGITILRLGKIIKWKKYEDLPPWIIHYALIAKMNLMGLMVICMFQNKAEHEFLYWPVAVAAILEQQVRQWAQDIDLKSEEWSEPLPLQ